MLHVAVLLKPYLDLILAGAKTVECRLTVQARDPFERIERGDRIYFKLSAGPYRATAIAGHVMFEADLTPRRVGEIRRDYNHLICGDAAFWNRKRLSRYCTLIWLKDVQATDSGPRIRPLQGVAWLTLEDEPAWRRVDAGSTRPDETSHERAKPPAAAASSASFFIKLTEGNLRNNSVYITDVIDRFPSWSIGGATKSDAARPITLMLHGGPTIETDIVGPRKLLRTRVWGRWFRGHGAKEGDRVVFTPMDERSYFVGLARDSTHRA